MLGNTGFPGLPLFDAITEAGLTSNLIAVLDAGDALSYGGSGQTWTDRSVAADNFYRGADGSPSTDDPTFNGSAGGLSIGEQFSGDGADFFTLTAATNPLSIRQVTRAGGLYSVFFGCYIPSSTGSETHLGSTAPIVGSNNGFDGFTFYLGTDKKLHWLVKDQNVTIKSVVADSAMSGAASHIVGISSNEATGAGGGFLWRDGAPDNVSGSPTFNSTYSQTDVLSPAGPMQIWRPLSDSIFAPAGSEVYFIAYWAAALTQANFDTLWQMMRGRIGL